MTDYARHPEYLALLRGVLIDPADDLPRLVLADWLEETGDADVVGWAEFVRLQIALAATGPEWQAAHDSTCRPPGFEGCPQRADRRREYELFRDNPRMRLGVLPGAFTASVGPCVVAAGPPHVQFDRGFVSAVTLTMAAFVGGECGYCDRGYVSAGPDSHWCFECERTGRTPGLAAALFATHPITAVTMADVEYRYTAARYTYSVARQSHPCVEVEWSANLTAGAAPLAAHLNPAYWQEARGGTVAVYPVPGVLTAREVINGDLSHAAVAYGRTLAALPPLGPHTAPGLHKAPESHPPAT